MVIDFVKQPTMTQRINKKLDFIKPVKKPEETLEEDIKKLEEDKAQLAKEKKSFEELANKVAMQSEVNSKPKRRGRPVGSKNKVEDATIRDSQ